MLERLREEHRAMVSQVAALGVRPSRRVEALLGLPVLEKPPPMTVQQALVRAFLPVVAG